MIDFSGFDDRPAPWGVGWDERMMWGPTWGPSTTSETVSVLDGTISIHTGGDELPGTTSTSRASKSSGS